MIKCIIFDNGGVIASTSSHFFVPSFKKYSDKPLHTLLQSYWELSYPLDTGDESEQDFYRKYSNHMGIKTSVKNLVRLRRAKIKLIPGTLKIIENLKKNYKLAMLNNEYRECMSFLLKKYNYFKYFKTRVTSSEVHCRKPDAKIYRILLRRLRLKPHECLFIDDLERNILAAKKLGINAILFRNPAQLKRDLRRFGVEA